MDWPKFPKANSVYLLEAKFYMSKVNAETAFAALQILTVNHINNASDLVTAVRESTGISLQRQNDGSIVDYYYPDEVYMGSDDSGCRAVLTMMAH